MKKFLILLFVLATFRIGVAGAYSSFTVNNLQVKKSTDSSFSNTINVATAGTQVIFSVNIIPTVGTEFREGRVSLILPAGLTYNSYTLESDTCADINGVSAGNLSVDSYTNNSFVFRFKPNGTVCENIVNIAYTTSSLVTGNYNINYTLSDSVDNIFGNGNDIVSSSNNIALNLTSKISLLKAYTFDLNQNGFIDRYDFTFDRNIVGTPNTQISQNGTSVTSGVFSTLGANSGSIVFTDSVFTTSETPQIKIIGDANYEDNTYFVGVVEDRASPKVTVTPAGGAFSSSQNVTITSNESGNIYYKLGSTASTGSTAYTGAFSVNSNTGVYYYVTDLVGNVSTGSVNFTFSCSPSTILNGTIGAYPSCTVSCNSGYNLSGGVCVATSGGGGGGGGGSISADYCPTGDLSGNFYDGICSAPTTSTGIISTGIIIIPTFPTIDYQNISGLNTSSLDVFYLSGIVQAKEYLHSNISNSAVLKLADSYFDKLSFNDSTYYTSFDGVLKQEYNRIINSYVLFFLKLDSFIKNRLESDKTDAKNLYLIISNYLKNKSLPEIKYINKNFYKDGIYIYKTKFQLIAIALDKLEAKILAKFEKLKDSKTITEEEYLSGINAYNDFVLNLTIYRMYNKPAEAKARAIKAINIWYNIYKKQILETPIISEIKAPQILLVKDKYTFSKDLKVGDYNDDVTNLQTILKMYGYFDALNPTGYFGNLTKDYLIKFAKDILKINSTTGVFDTNMRNAIGNLELK
ncbi:chitobiase/beta-hexosaminidase C-terminal domain-containing protein [Candidatus Gracilibacteria bacterium]|nr:chitobiase/beta-hexosaminidase C-terminal domain-containing protein [Candidatus Gracilibacteria bacterium]